MCFAPQRRALCRRWGVLYVFTSKRAPRHNSVQLFISHLSRWLRTRRFSEPTFGPSGATNHRINTVFRDFSTFSGTLMFFLLLFSSLTLPTLCFSSVHIVGSLASKFPSTTTLQLQLQLQLHFNYTSAKATTTTSTTLQLLPQLQLQHFNFNFNFNCTTTTTSTTSTSTSTTTTSTTTTSTTRTTTTTLQHQQHQLHYNYSYNYNHATTTNYNYSYNYISCLYATLRPTVLGEVTTATTPKSTTTFRSMSGFAPASMHHSNSPLL